MKREDAKTKAQSRDCSCVAGKDRDSNFNYVIDEVFDYFERKTTSVFIVCENDNYGEDLYLATKDTLKEAEELKGNDTTRNIYEYEINLDHVFNSKIKAFKHKCKIEGFEDYGELKKAAEELRCLKVAKRLLNDE